MMICLAVGIPCILASAALAAGPMAPLTDRALRQKYDTMDRYWDEMLDSCSQKGPDKRSAAWLRRQKTALGGGKLCRERALALYEAGYVSNAGDTAALTPLVEERARFTFRPTGAERLGCAALAAALPLWLTLAGAGAPTIALSVPSTLLLLHILICDLRARIIPYQATVAYAAAALAWVALLDTPYLAANAVLALIACAILALTEHYAVRFTGASAIGGGDRRIIPVIVFQIGLGGMLPGLVALCLVAGTMALVALARGRSRRSYLPFAPALFAMAVVGCACGVPGLSGICI